MSSLAFDDGRRNENQGGETDVHDEAIVERLRSIDEKLERIEDHRLAGIEEHLKTLNGRMGSAERWQSAADQMFESVNERIGLNSDQIESFQKEAKAQLALHQTFIDRNEGGMSARTQMIIQYSTLAGLGLALLKLFVFHN